MRILNYLISFGLVLVALLSSCSIEKRHHLPGYYIEEFNHKKNLHQPVPNSTITKIQEENKVVQESTTLTASISDIPSDFPPLIKLIIEDLSQNNVKLITLTDSTKEEYYYPRKNQNTTPTQDEKISSWAIAGFASSLIGFLFIFYLQFILGILLFGILGIIFSSIGLKRIKRGEDKRGRYLARIGKILGIIDILLFLLLVLLVVIIFMTFF